MQRTCDQGINIWFWSRNDTTVPTSVSEGADTIVPDGSWGIPDATFPPDTCNYESHFDAHQLVFDLTFCVSLVLPPFGSSYLISVLPRSGRLGRPNIYLVWVRTRL